MSLITYDATIRRLMTVPEDFANRDTNVLSLVWRPGIEIGVLIIPDTQIADIQWDNNEKETLSVPANCTGKILSLNRNIDFENLHFLPVFLLSISTEVASKAE